MRMGIEMTCRGEVVHNSCVSIIIFLRLTLIEILG